MKQLIHMKRERQMMLARWVLADTAGILGVYFGAMLLAGRSINVAGKAVLIEKGWFVVLAVSTFLLWSQGLYAIQAKYVNLRDLGRIYGISAVSTLTVFAVNYSATTPWAEQIRFPLIYGFGMVL